MPPGAPQGPRCPGGGAPSMHALEAPLQGCWSTVIGGCAGAGAGAGSEAQSVAGGCVAAYVGGWRPLARLQMSTLNNLKFHWGWAWKRVRGPDGLTANHVSLVTSACPALVAVRTGHRWHLHFLEFWQWRFLHLPQNAKRIPSSVPPRQLTCVVPTYLPQHHTSSQYRITQLLPS